MSIPTWGNCSLDQMLRNISIQVEQKERNGLINIHNFNERALYNNDYKIFDLVFTINWNTIYLGIQKIHEEETRLLQENQMLFVNVIKQNGTHLLIGNGEWNKTMMECEYDNLEQQNDFLSSTYDELIKTLLEKMNNGCPINIKKIFIKEIIRRATGYNEEINSDIFNILLHIDNPKELIRIILFIIGQIEQMKKFVPVIVKNERKRNIEIEEPPRKIYFNHDTVSNYNIMNTSTNSFTFN